ncbi:glycosyltransferase [Paraliobacillus sediminis]|uniref:glycosyltransferase n=1 Tax=Paraliobacillus sediminis TaxID=1885916 RepID=UPI000E3D189C|nr:glycosyltransferase [Paraliobacillus sediminis]
MEQKISVIVPIYRVEKFLSKCIESIINQTYFNLEIILVDDGSPDRCFEICEKYASMDNRIVVIRKENGGLSDARNAGLKAASGNYISFIDSDDYIYETFYECLLNLIIKNDADIAQCGYQIVEEDQEFTPIRNEKAIEDIVVLDKLDILHNLYNINYGDTVVVWNKLFKSNLFNNLFFPKGKVHEDELTTYQILYRANKVAITSKKMYFYLQRSDSIMGQGFTIKSLDKLEAYYNQIKFYNDNELIELKEKATKSLEGMIKATINRVVKSNFENKTRVLNSLIDYYKKNLHLFSIFPSSKKIKLTRNLFRYTPVFIIRWIYKVVNIRRKVEF